MTRPRTVANWRGHLARTQSYYEEGEKTFSKVKNVVIVVALGKYLGLSGWLLYLAAPSIMIGVAVFGWAWVRFGWYAHNTEIGVLEQWTPISRWQAWVTVLTAKALRIDLSAIPTDRLPEEFTRVMASTQRRDAGVSATAYDAVDRLAAIRRGEVPQTDGRD